MFNVKHTECVGFESRWKVKRVSSETSTQTDQQKLVDIDVNTTEKSNNETQTENTNNPQPEIDMQKLAEWLKKIYPKVKRELDDSSNSKIFRGYQLCDDNSDAKTILAQDIEILSDGPTRVTALSWNSKGKTLAVACNYTHKTWCYHNGFVALYTLDRDDRFPKNPTKKINIMACVTVLEFHSQNPDIIAIGTVSGEILIANIANAQEECILTSKDAHDLNITQLSWIQNMDFQKDILLASSALEGHLILWNINLEKNIIQIKTRYKIKCPAFTTAKKALNTKKVVRGVLCFDFAPNRPDLFIVGAEGGLVVECSTENASQLKKYENGQTVWDPVYKYYESHEGEVNSIKISPNRKEMFLTCGNDAEIRIYIIGQEEPAQVIFLKEPLNDITWVLYEDKIVAGCGDNGLIEIFHIVEGKPIKNSEKKESINSLNRLSINKLKINLLATGTEGGHLQLWKVPWNLFSNIKM